MTTFRYRISSGEVVGASVDPWPSMTDPYFAQVTDPPTPDGIALVPVKIYSGGQVKNAKQNELNGFAAFAATDELLRERVAAKGLLETDLLYRKVLRALLYLLVDELNILRQAAGLSARTYTQALTAIKNKIDAGDVD